MIARSLLFAPGDSPRKIEKAAISGADVVILDLEDSVLPEGKAAAREIVAQTLAAKVAGVSYWVRVNPLSTNLIDADIAAIALNPPDVIMLPKVDSAADVLTVSQKLDAAGFPASVGICPVATETAKALFNLGTYEHAGPRLVALTWGAEDLAAALGASTNKGDDGEFGFIYQLARAHCLAGAVTAGVTPIETVSTEFRDVEAIEKFARRAARDGFLGMMVIHPAQVAPVNRAFTPDEATIAHANAVLGAFAAKPGAGAVSLDGKMVDIPHLRQAEKILARAAALASKK